MIVLRFLIGPLGALGILALDLPLEDNAHKLSALLFCTIAWWIFEPVPLAVTSLLVPVFAVIFEITNLKSALAPFAHPVVLLFWGGFVLAAAMAHHRLDQRIALYLMTRSFIKGSSWRVVVTCLLTCSLLSMWMTNLATTAMLTPICLGVLSALIPNDIKTQGKILLALAYASSIGGIFTPVGSTPNLIAVGMLDKISGIKVDFLTYSIYTAPIGIISLAFLIFVFRKSIFSLPNKDLSFLHDRYKNLGSISRGEKNVMIALGFAILMWFGSGLVFLILGVEHDFSIFLKKHFPTASVALIAALSLFFLPLQFKPFKSTIDWKIANNVDWGSLFLFGGGLSLGAMMFETGLADLIGNSILGPQSNGTTPIILLFFVVGLSMLMTEFVSNTATSNLLIPIVISIVSKTDFNLAPVIIALATGCSMAFMLPVATPPNAVVYSTGRVKVYEMIKNGVWMNIGCAIIIVILMSLRV